MTDEQLDIFSTPTEPAPLVLPRDGSRIPQRPTETITTQFEAFHAANPWVLDRLMDMTEELVAAGHRRVGIGMLWEVLRWKHMRRTTTNDFKLNNNFRSRYVRLMIDLHPEWADVFEMRVLRSA